MRDAVLVTGGGGFVGSAVVRRIAARLQAGPLRLAGDEEIRHVVALLRPGGSALRLEELDAGPRWSLREADLGRPEELRAVLREIRPAAVVHTAVDWTGFQAAEPTDEEPQVASILRELATGLGRARGRRLIHTGSVWVLPAGERLAETEPLAPTSPYARAKALEDRLLPELASAAGVEWVNLRLFNLFGRYERPERLIPYLVGRLSRGLPADLSEPGNVRDFTDVDLVADAFVLALEAPAAAANELYHIGTGRGIRIARVADTVASLVGGRELLRYGRMDTPDRAIPVQVADIGRSTARLGWNPAGDVETRIAATVRWWQRRLASASAPVGR